MSRIDTLRALNILARGIEASAERILATPTAPETASGADRKSVGAALAVVASELRRTIETVDPDYIFESEDEQT
jgi:hypothetical protein